MEGTISTDLVRGYLQSYDRPTLQQISSHIFRDPGIPLVQAIMRDWEMHGHFGKQTVDYSDV